MTDKIERLLGKTWIECCPVMFEDAVFTDEQRRAFGFLHYVYIRANGIKCPCAPGGKP